MMSIYCPICREECDHEVLKESADLLVRCAECGHVHHIPKEKPSAILSIRTIVSHETESQVCSVEMLSDDECAVGDLVAAECGDDVIGAEIASIESGDKRVQRAVASDVTTLWTRVIEKVVVKASVHSGRTTIPLYQAFDGEEEFIVGEVYSFGKVRFRISHIKMREGQVLRKEGWKTVARKIKRIYAYKI